MRGQSARIIASSWCLCKALNHSVDYIKHPVSCSLMAFCEWKVHGLWSKHFFLTLDLILSEKRVVGKEGRWKLKVQILNKKIKAEDLKEEDDVPDESQDDGGVSISNISCIDTDQLDLRIHMCLCEQPINMQEAAMSPCNLLCYSRSSPPGKTGPWQCCWVWKYDGTTSWIHEAGKSFRMQKSYWGE